VERSATSGDTERLGDTGDAGSVTRNHAAYRVNDANNAGDAPSSTPGAEDDARARDDDPEKAVSRVLTHPLVAEALALFAPPNIDVRLPDGSKWSMRRNPAEGRPQAEAAVQDRTPRTAKGV
jgi:hypothetical protein